MTEKRFRANFDVSIYDSEKEEYISASGRGLEEIAKIMNEQQATINELKEENDKLIQKNCIPCELVNLQTREIDKLKEENEQLRLELETHKHPLWSTREAERKLSEVTNNLANEIKKNGLLNEELNQLRIENMRLKKRW